MELIIDFDGIGDPTKKDWLLNTLKMMGINFQTAEKRQTIDEYNQESEEGKAEYKKGTLYNNRRTKKENGKMVVVWTGKAESQLQKAFEYIQKDSHQMP